MNLTQTKINEYRTLENIDTPIDLIVVGLFSLLIDNINKCKMHPAGKMLNTQIIQNNPELEHIFTDSSEIMQAVINFTHNTVNPMPTFEELDCDLRIKLLLLKNISQFNKRHIKLTLNALGWCKWKKPLTKRLSFMQDQINLNDFPDFRNVQTWIAYFDLMRKDAINANLITSEFVTSGQLLDYFTNMLELD